MTLRDVEVFWDRRPCNVRHSGIDIDEDPLKYSMEVTNKKYFVEPHIVPFSQFAKWENKRVLDAGCGIGTMTLSFAAMGAQVVAVDISEQSIEIARKRAIALGLEKRIQFIASPIEELSGHLPVAEKFDLVYSFGVVHHTPYPCSALLELRKFVIPDGGKFKLMLYHKTSWKVLQIMLGHWWGHLHAPHGDGLDRLIQEHSEAQTGCPVTHTYTRKSAIALLDDCGFRVTDLTIDHIFPYRIPAYIEGRYEKKCGWQWLPACTFQWLEKHFGWHILIDAIPDMAGWHRHFGFTAWPIEKSSFE